jgi:hypothetical protein
MGALRGRFFINAPVEGVAEDAVRRLERGGDFPLRFFKIIRVWQLKRSKPLSNNWYNNGFIGLYKKKKKNIL